MAYFLTITAPGDNPHRRWRQGRGGNDRPECHCHENGLTLGQWNARAAAFWNVLRLALWRAAGEDLQYIGSVEVQEGAHRADTRGRGALHRHVVLVVKQALTPEQVQALALAAGYGCVFDLQEIHSAKKAAWYVAKYVTKSSGTRGLVPWRKDVLDAETGELREMETDPTFRTWSSSHGWGFTMKGMREVALLQARARAMYLAELQALLDQDKAGGLAPDTSAGTQDPGPPG